MSIVAISNSLNNFKDLLASVVAGEASVQVAGVVLLLEADLHLHRRGAAQIYLSYSRPVDRGSQ
jgi:hypothetical protein